MSLYIVIDTVEPFNLGFWNCVLGDLGTIDYPGYAISGYAILDLRNLNEVKKEIVILLKSAELLILGFK